MILIKKNKRRRELGIRGVRKEMIIRSRIDHCDSEILIMKNKRAEERPKE